MIANLPIVEKEAFFSLLDEYFASRPHRLPSISNTTSSTSTSSAGGFSDRATAAAGNAAGAAAGAAVTSHLRDQLARTGFGGRKSQPPPAPPSTNKPAASFPSQNKGFNVPGLVTTKTLGSFHTGSRAPSTPSAATTTTAPSAPQTRTLPPPARRGTGVPSPAPAQYSEPVPAVVEATTSVPEDVIGTAEVLFDYGDGTDEDDLPAKEGEHIYLLEKISDDWWRATSEDLSRQGIIPTTYVRQIS